MKRWIEQAKGDRPFAAGALAYMLGLDCSYGCHFGMRSTADWARQQFAQGWHTARLDHLASDAWGSDT
jgi:hypothetical protein